MNMILCDPSAERAVLSCIIQYGEDAFLDVSDLITESTFTVDSNQIIFRCLKNIGKKLPLFNNIFKRNFFYQWK